MSRPSTGASSQCGDPKCVCALCTCGQHHCDALQRAAALPKQPFDGTSTTQTDFHAHPPCRANGYKPEAKRHGADAPFEGQSVNHTDYVQLPRQDPAWQRTTPAYRPNKLAFDGTTTSKQDYVDFGNAKREPIVRQDVRKEPGKGVYEPTYASDYPGYTIPKQPAVSPPKATIAPGNAPFSTQTTSSEYRAYPEHERRTMISPVRVHRPPSQPLQATTESRSAYNGAPAERASPFKPQTRTIDKLPGTYQTTYGTDLTPKSAEPSQSYKPAGTYTGPAGTFRGDTTQKADFTDKGVAKRDSMRPHAAQRRDPGRFDGTTISKQDYQGHGPVCPSSLLSVQKRAELSRLHKS
eukprot:m.73608 g.73608  ORF g.73608 m.73608 type:complete len:351 (+) comp10237_c0_seq2:4549-5601(+)